MADKMLENNRRAEQQAKEVYDLARKLTAELHAGHHRPAGSARRSHNSVSILQR